MKSIFPRTAVIICWIITTGWLIRYEAYPEYFTHSLSGYSSLLPDELLSIDSWMKISFKDAHIGYSHTSMEVNDANPSEYYTIRNRIQVNFKFMNKLNDVMLLTTANLNKMRHLQAFSASFSSQDYMINITGKPLSGKLFDVNIKNGGNDQRMTIEIPDDAIFYFPMTDINLKMMKPDKSINIRILDPISLRKNNMQIKYIRKDKLKISGNYCKTTILSFGYQGTEILTWVDNGGSIVRQEIAQGLSMEKCTPEEAFAAIRDASNADDILNPIFGTFLKGS